MNELKNKKFIKILFFLFIGLSFFNLREIEAFVPSYNLPSKEFLKKNGSIIGKNAYQLLYFGQFKEGLQLARLAISLNPQDENLWLVLSEALVNNKLYEEALTSLNKGKNLNPNVAAFYFAESSIFFKQANFVKAKYVLMEGLKIQPNNTNAIFQLGNIFLIEKNYKKALGKFNKAIETESNYWQAHNNKGLAYFELNKKLLAVESFKKAISINENAESLLALACLLIDSNRNEAINLAKNALNKDSNYVFLKYREEQLWGENIQKATDKLFQLKELEQIIKLSKLYEN